MEYAKRQKKEQHLERLSYWLEKLRTKSFQEGERENALFEISKMKEEEALKVLLPLLSEGIEYFRENKERSTSKDEYYQTLVEWIGRMGLLQSGSFLIQTLQHFLKDLEQRYTPEDIPVAEASHLAALVQALAQSRIPQQAQFVADLRWKLQKNTLFLERTHFAFKRLSSLDQFQESPSCSRKTLL
jgi:hypothetical protein